MANEWMITIDSRVKAINKLKKSHHHEKLVLFRELLDNLNTAESEEMLQACPTVHAAIKRCFTRNYLLLSEEERQLYEPFTDQFLLSNVTISQLF